MRARWRHRLRAMPPLDADLAMATARRAVEAASLERFRAGMRAGCRAIEE